MSFGQSERIAVKLPVGRPETILDSMTCSFLSVCQFEENHVARTQPRRQKQSSPYLHALAMILGVIDGARGNTKF